MAFFKLWWTTETYRLIIRDRFLALLLLIPFVASCVIQPPAEGLLPAREITQNNLSLVPQWSQVVGRYPGQRGLPIACHEDLGTILSIVDGPPNWQGTVLFNHSGEVLWNRPGDQSASDVTLDGQAVYVYDPAVIRAYTLDSGETLWETNESLYYRLGITRLITQDDRLLFLSHKQVNSYATDDGSLISQEPIRTENFVLRYEGLDFYSGNGHTLYATIAGNQEAFLWQAPYYTVHLPHVYQDDLIIQPRATGNVCSLRLEDGQTNWCSEKQLSSNIAVHNNLGYGLEWGGDVVAFRLSDGASIGRLTFDPSHKDTYGFVATCENHLLVYLTLPDEIFWFDFVTE